MHGATMKVTQKMLSFHACGPIFYSISAAMFRPLQQGVWTSAELRIHIHTFEPPSQVPGLISVFSHLVSHFPFLMIRWDHTHSVPHADIRNYFPFGSRQIVLLPSDASP
jgi:hypothetical protein